MQDLKAELYEQIKELVEQGKYPSIETFIEVALKNQILLEKSIGDKEKVVNTNREQGLGQNKYQDLSLIEEKPITVSPAPISSTRKSLPLWGMINRVAPAKVSLRLLSNMLAESGTEWISFSEFSEKLTAFGYNIRLQLEKREKKLDVIRGESIKMGLPLKDLKSQQRFIDIYVGRLRTDNTNDGLLADLEFAVIRKMTDGNISKSVIGITDYGYEFAKLHSPLIDDCLVKGETVSDALSEEEVIYLLRHIEKVRQADLEFLSFIYRSVKGGSNSPKQLAKLASHYFEKYKLKSNFINTMQGGALARLVEMRLIRIVKNGIYSSYQVSPSNNTMDRILTEPTIPQFEV
jgi:hypothetical protein